MKEKLKALESSSAESHDRTTLINQYKSHIATKLFSQQEELTTENISQMERDLDNIKNHSSIPDETHELLKSSFELGEVVIQKFNNQYPNPTKNNFRSEILSALINTFISKFEEVKSQTQIITQEDEDKMPAMSPSSSSYAKDIELPKRELTSDEIASEQPELKKSKSEDARKNDEGTTFPSSSPKPTHDNDSPLRKQEQLIELMGISKDQFEEIDPKTREIICQNLIPLIPKLELASKKDVSSQSKLKPNVPSSGVII